MSSYSSLFSKRKATSEPEDSLPRSSKSLRQSDSFSSALSQTHSHYHRTPSITLPLSSPPLPSPPSQDLGANCTYATQTGYRSADSLSSPDIVPSITASDHPNPASPTGSTRELKMCDADSHPVDIKSHSLQSDPGVFCPKYQNEQVIAFANATGSLRIEDPHSSSGWDDDISDLNRLWDMKCYLNVARFLYWQYSIRPISIKFRAWRVSGVEGRAEEGVKPLRAEINIAIEKGEKRINGYNEERAKEQVKEEVVSGFPGKWGEAVNQVMGEPGEVVVNIVRVHGETDDDEMGEGEDKRERDDVDKDTVMVSDSEDVEWDEAQTPFPPPTAALPSWAQARFYPEHCKGPTIQDTMNTGKEYLTLAVTTVTQTTQNYIGAQKNFDPKAVHDAIMPHIRPPVAKFWEKGKIVLEAGIKKLAVDEQCNAIKQRIALAQRMDRVEPRVYTLSRSLGCMERDFELLNKNGIVEAQKKDEEKVRRKLFHDTRPRPSAGRRESMRTAETIMKIKRERWRKDQQQRQPGNCHFAASEPVVDMEEPKKQYQVKIRKGKSKSQGTYVKGHLYERENKMSEGREYDWYHTDESIQEGQSEWKIPTLDEAGEDMQERWNALPRGNNMVQGDGEMQSNDASRNGYGFSIAHEQHPSRVQAMLRKFGRRPFTRKNNCERACNDLELPANDGNDDSDDNESGWSVSSLGPEARAHIQVEYERLDCEHHWTVPYDEELNGGSGKLYSRAEAVNRMEPKETWERQEMLKIKEQEETRRRVIKENEARQRPEEGWD